MKITTLLEVTTVERMFYFGACDWSMSEAKYWFYDTLEGFIKAMRATGIVDPASWDQENDGKGPLTFDEVKTLIEDHFEAENGGDNGMDIGENGPNATTSKAYLLDWVKREMLGEDTSDESEDDDGFKNKDIKVYANKPVNDLEFVERAEGK